MTDVYRADLAHVHDAGFGALARSAATVLVETLRQQGTHSGLVVDLGCGSGITAQILSDAGYEVLGVDISADLIEIARSRVPRAEFRVESFLNTNIPECVAVTAIGECFNYAFDGDNTPDERSGLFRRVHRALQAGGIFLFDVAGPGRVPGTGSTRTHTEGEDWVVLMTAEENLQRRRLTRRITTFRKVSDLYRRDHEVHELNLLERPEIRHQLQDAGFQVRILDGYGPTGFAPGHAGFLARKGRERE
ncbi:MAG: class I SAM-dependent methyltransferase [Rubrobacteraceae bacterium]